MPGLYPTAPSLDETEPILNSCFRQPAYNTAFDDNEDEPVNVTVSDTGTNSKTKKYFVVAGVMAAVGLLIGLLFLWRAGIILAEELPYGRACFLNGTQEDYCGSDLKCIQNSRDGAGRCGCPSKYYKWDKSLGLCVALVNKGAECRSRAWDGTPPIPCTENAECTGESSDGKKHCQCVNFYTDVDDECIPAYNAQCKRSSDCNQEDFLTCGEQSGRCECRPGTIRHRSESRGSGCFVTIGETCDGRLANRCIDKHSFCDHGLHCRCNATAGYTTASENKRCGKMYQEPCSTKSKMPPCADSLTCIGANSNSIVLMDSNVNSEEGICTCRLDEQYDEKLGRCRIRANQECSEASGNQCIAHAMCANGLCACDYDREPNSKGVCEGTNGIPCNKQETCSSSNFFECKNSRCQCNGQHSYYDENRRSCVGQVGAKCTGDLNCNARSAECGGDGRCKCKAGYKAWTDNNCYGTSSTTCGSTAECFKGDFLSCIAGRCGCDWTKEEYDEAEGKCKILAKHNCQEPGWEKMPCVGNLACLLDPTTNSKICTCPKSLVLSPDSHSCVSGAGRVTGWFMSLVFSTFIILKFEK